MDLKKKFIRKEHKRLIKILENYSKTEYAILMEIKLKIVSNKIFCYLHWHVISGSINNFSMVRGLWKRVIKYEEANRIDNLTLYITKYDLKTPYFYDYYTRGLYHLLVNKTQIFFIFYFVVSAEF